MNKYYSLDKMQELDYSNKDKKQVYEQYLELKVKSKLAITHIINDSKLGFGHSDKQVFVPEGC